MSSIQYHVIETLHDDYLEGFLDRLQDDFPANEQIYTSYFLRKLKQKEQIQTSDITLLCALDGEGGPLIGMACSDIEDDKQAAILWYLAIDPEKRNQGLGSQLYHEVVRRVRAQYPSLHYLLYEVERPDQTHNAEEANIARRRIDFYRRNGGQVCTNIVYWQKVRNEPRLMMYLIAHAFQPEDREPARVLEAVCRVFGRSIEPVETLILE